ncbi:hypothetical protein BVC93_02670 [Mycobacterium sp. MS1601]|uniref:LuxR C-terminal-related transcriptional regulator n=1 Tax=Mycobacterium sp. MS1601 TaxID=1936029 RepID=UPI0009797CF2|nr:response regulator transcription factor [Mycobacterium sp. MS1601]AQA01516.1 hypothetical protein BVC93_02670 [Mycobacterium sp. MS1601]
MNDDLLRHGLIHVASQAMGVQVVAESRLGPGLFDDLQDLQFDLLVLGVDSEYPLAQVLGQWPADAKVIAVIDDTDATRQAVGLLRAGVDGLIHRRSPSHELLNTIQRVIEGKPTLDSLSSESVIAELRCAEHEPVIDQTSMLTRREQEVLALLTEGLDNRTIAKRLFIAEATVKFHLHNIMEKFGVHKRAALVSAALRGRRSGSRSGTVGYLFPASVR